MRVQLDIYIEPSCENCEQAFVIADLVRDRLPQVEVSLIDITAPGSSPPDSIFAVPTYLVNGETCSLGNPDGDQLVNQLQELAAA